MDDKEITELLGRAKPCPFCGGRSLSVREGSTFRWLIAECAECGACCGEVRRRTLGPGTIEERGRLDIADVIEAWNTRHDA